MEENDNVVSIKSAKSKRRAVIEELEDAPLELYEPVATLLHGTDYMVRACDGDDEYVWLVTQATRGKLKVTEVYPGESKRKTNLRDLRDSDLELEQRFTDIDDAMALLTEMVMDGIVLDGTES